jgi:hypothetical protein
MNRFDLTIDFSGLCTFVTNDMPEMLRVILLQDTKGHAAHAPRLTFDVRDLADFTGDGISQVIQLADGTQLASWDLSGKILALGAIEGAPKSKYCGPAKPPADAPRDALEEMAFCWVPSLGLMGGVGGGKGAVVPEKYLGPDPGLKGPVAARFDTPHGYLMSNVQANRTMPKEVWEFGPGKQQYLAEAVRLEIREIGEKEKEIELTAKKFDGGDGGTLKLKPHSGSISVSLTNLPRDVRHHSECKLNDHFKMYYELFDSVTDGLVPTKPQSVAMAHDGEHGTGRGIFPARCTPAQTP